MNEFHRDFEGGRFIFIDENKDDNRTAYSSIEPKKGRVSVFTSGGENVHHIEKVTQGIRYECLPKILSRIQWIKSKPILFRYAMTISFTCNREFAIADPAEQKQV